MKKGDTVRVKSDATAMSSIGGPPSSYVGQIGTVLSLGVPVHHCPTCQCGGWDVRVAFTAADELGVGFMADELEFM